MSLQGSFEDYGIAVCYARLDGAGDPLLFLEKHMSWEGLRVIMSRIRFDRDGNGGKGGRRPLDGLMMAKLLVLQSLYGLSDEAMEYTARE